MIRINLLPIKEIKARLRRRRELFAFAGSLLLLLVLLGVTALFFNGQVNRLEQTSAELADQQRSYLALQRQINQLKEDREDLETKLAAIEQLRVDSQLPVRVLDEVSRRTPTQRMWLNSMRILDNTANLTGVGLDNPTIAQYMRNLEGSSYFAGADLNSSSQTEVEGRKLKAFALTVSIAPPAGTAAAEEPEATTGGGHGR